MDLTKYDKLIDREFPSGLTIRDIQRETLRMICHAYENGKTHFIAQLPTGTGKSLIAITFAKIIKNYYNKKSMLLTKTKALQDQYKTEFPFIDDLKGKNNYPCKKSKKASIVYGDSRCVKYLKNKQCSLNRCPYIQAREKFSKNDFLRMTNMTLACICPSNICGVEHSVEENKPDNKSDVMIIDECHKVTTELIENGSIILNTKEIDNLRSGSKIFNFDLSNFDSYIEKLIIEFNKNTNNNILNIKSVDFDGYLKLLNLVKKLNGIIDDDLADLYHYKLKDYISKLLSKILLLRVSSGNFVYFFDEKQNEFKLIPLRAYSVNFQLINKADFFLHMSATIGDVYQYMKEFGIDSKNTDYYEVDSPFPIENRKIKYIPLINFSYKNQEEAVNIISEAIDQVISTEKGRGIIHTSSYYFAKQFKEKSNFENKLRIPENSEEVTMYKNMDYHIISPSLQEGYDFKDDLARWQILTKVPYPSLGDVYTKVKMNYDSDWYSQETVNKIIQSYGRAIRHKDDYATFYIFDANFERFKNSKFIPNYIKEAIEEI